jgi:tetratricopeptide (TPR) repeat protein
MTRLRQVLLLTIILLGVVEIAPAAEVLTNDTIVTMVKAGLGEELIISKIKITQAQFDLSTDGILKLKKEGVGNTIIKAMMEAPPASPAAEMAPGESEAIALYRQGRTAEAVAAFDRLLAEKPNDEGLKIWKALALLKQAGEMKESKVPGYKPVVLKAWAILQPMGQRQATNPDWNFAAAKALWLNDRPERAGRVVQRALAVRPNFAEAHLLLGDMAYDEAVAQSTADPATRWRSGLVVRKRYEMVLALPDPPSELQAEVLFKMGLVSEDFESKKGEPRGWWEKAAATDPASRYGRMAQEKLKAVPAK